MHFWIVFVCITRILLNRGSVLGGGTSLLEASGDVSLDKVAFSQLVWLYNNGVALSIELLEWGRTFSDFWGKKVLHIYGYLWLANVPECLYCRWKVKRSSFNIKNGSIHFRTIFRIRLRYIKRKWLSWDRENYTCQKLTEMGSKIGHRLDYNGVGALRGQRQKKNKKINPSTTPRPPGGSVPYISHFHVLEKTGTFTLYSTFLSIRWGR